MQNFLDFAFYRDPFFLNESVVQENSRPSPAASVPHAASRQPHVSNIANAMLLLPALSIVYQVREMRIVSIRIVDDNCCLCKSRNSQARVAGGMILPTSSALLLFELLQLELEVELKIRLVR